MKANSTEKLILKKSCYRSTGYHHGSQKKQKQSGQPSTSACKNLKPSKANPISSHSGPSTLRPRATGILQTGPKQHLGAEIRQQTLQGSYF
eukprot:676186-Pelagomonas_calceolata.AAC.1